MYHEVKVRASDDLPDGWFEIVQRGTPRGAFVRLATVWGERRATKLAEFLQRDASA